MYKRLKELIKAAKGNVLAICLDDSLMSELLKNEKISLYSLVSNEPTEKLLSPFGNTTKLSNLKQGRKRKTKYKKNNKGKDINIKKLKKEINKKSADYIFCNMNEMINYYKYFIRDSIYMTRGSIYIYFTEDSYKDFIISRYKRYNVKIKETKFKTGYLLEIDAKNSKNNFIKDKLYFIKDTMYNIAEIIGNLMIS